MRETVALWLLLGACAVPSIAQATDSPLDVSASVVSQKECMSHSENSFGQKAEAAFITFVLRLRIHNVGGRSIILCRACIGDSGPRLRATGADGNPGEMIAEIIADRFGFEKPPHFSSHSNENYVIIKSGDVFEIDATASVFGTVESQYPPQTGRLAAGKYFLYGNFVAWWQPSNVTIALKARWKKYGDLYGGDLETPAIPVTIDFPANMPACAE